ncbi:MAG: IPT/TIG domain-containing protein [Planctomycetota bacterium]
MSVFRRITALSVMVLAIAAAGCGGGGGGGGAAAIPAKTTVNGLAFKGPLGGATVQIHTLLSTGVRGSLLGSGVSQADGTFEITFDPHTGPIWIEVTGGSYADEATGAAVSVPVDTPLFGVGESQQGSVKVVVSALSHLVAMRARSLASHPESSATEAVRNATRMVEDYFGLQDLAHLTPADLTAGPVAPGGAAELGAAHAGFSEFAAGFADPPLHLLTFLGHDIADGSFDGTSFGTILSLPQSGPIPSETGGAHWRDAIRAFLTGNPRNISGLGPDSVSIDESIDAHIDGTASHLLPMLEVHSMDVTGGEIAGGTTVRITGIDLPDPVEVRFGGQSAAIVANDSVSITVITPAAAALGRADVLITDPVSGLERELPAAFEYFQPAPPSVQSVNPGAGPVTGGTLIEIEGSGLDSTTQVQVGGVAAAMLLIEPPRRAVAIAPPGSGTADITVSNQQGSITIPALFEYRAEDVGAALPGAAIAGDWRFYAVGHDEAGGGVFHAARIDAVLDGTGGATFEETRRETSPADLQGTVITETGPASYALLADGSVWFDLDPTVAPGVEILRGTIDRRASVIGGGLVEVPGRTGLTVGVRKGSGLSNVSLLGTWWVAGMFHRYDDATGARKVNTFFATAVLDGQGSGSVAGRLLEKQPGASAPDLSTDLFYSLTYSVSGDGTFTLIVDSETTLEGSVSPDGGFCGAVTLGADGELGMMLMVRRGFGLPQSAMAGNWGGGSLAFQTSGTEPTYLSSRESALLDAAGGTLSRKTWRAVRPSEPLGRAVAGLDGDSASLAPSGRITAADLRRVAVVGADRRLALVLLEDELMLGLLAHRPGYYSEHSLAGEHHRTSLRHSDPVLSSPPAMLEELECSHGTVGLDPVTPFVLPAGLPGAGTPLLLTGTAFVSSGPRKLLQRDWGGDLVTDTSATGDLVIGYTVMGDGAVLLFEGAPTGLGFVEGFLRPDGDSALIHNPAGEHIGSTLAGAPDTFLMALGRRAVSVPPVGVEYRLGALSMGFQGIGTILRTSTATRGVLALDSPSAGLYGGSAETLTALEDGSTLPSPIPLQGSWSMSLTGEITVMQGGASILSGFVTPDGEAMFLVDVDPASTDVALSVLLRQPASAPALPPALSILTVAEEFVWIPTFPPAEDRFSLTRGVGSIDTGLIDVGFDALETSNNQPAPLFGCELSRGNVIAAQAGGLLTVTTDSGVLRGGVSAGGRHGFLLPGEPQIDAIQLVLTLGR